MGCTSNLTGREDWSIDTHSGGYIAGSWINNTGLDTNRLCMGPMEWSETNELQLWSALYRSSLYSIVHYISLPLLYSKRMLIYESQK